VKEPDKYKKLGFNSLDEYANYFFSTLLPSNKTYEYFVDWEKVKENIFRYLNEISLLNTLSRVPSNQRKERFIEIIKEYPRVVKVIPVLIAERIKNSHIDIFDPDLEELIRIDLDINNIDETSLQKITEFVEKVGVLALFSEIKDLYDYLMGVEVGIDTNARKNRSGKIFEDMVEGKLRKILRSYKILRNDTNFSLYKQHTKFKTKTHDFTIYKDNLERPIAIVECSFYNISGSKEISISESYEELSNLARNLNISFIWVTDGPAWIKMKGQILHSIRNIDWILNYKMLELIKFIVEK